jgi:transcriptional regulator with XRE-family HTH domain
METDPIPHFNAMPVLIRGQHYPSQRAAAAALGVTESAVSRMLTKRGELSVCGLRKYGAPGNRNASRPLTIGPLTFESRTKAAERLGITRNQISRWISKRATPGQREMLIAAVMRLSMKEGPRRSEGQLHRENTSPGGRR